MGCASNSLSTALTEKGLEEIMATIKHFLNVDEET